jgi:hypothetical protein
MWRNTPPYAAIVMRRPNTRHVRHCKTGYAAYAAYCRSYVNRVPCGRAISPQRGGTGSWLLES